MTNLHHSIVAIFACALISLLPSDTLMAYDGGPDGGAYDAGAGYCAIVDDTCCLDNGSSDVVASLAGCNGPSTGPVATGETMGECTHDPAVPGPMGNCGGIDVCWPYPNWYDEFPTASGGECGLCLRWCTEMGGCPDGFNPDPDVYDFCSSDCPAGSRCWVYDFAGSTRGLCMADCASNDDCSSGVCDPLWNICVPRIGECPGEELPDSGPPDTDDDSEGGIYEFGGSSETGCLCNLVSGADNPPSIPELLLQILL